MPDFQILEGDCIEVMRELPADSIDAITTDPPYGLGFMGHQWDQPGVKVPEQKEGVPPGQRRIQQPAPSGISRDGKAMEAGRYDLSRSANHGFQAWTEAWAREAFRVLKPGGFLLAFGGTRTYHRLASGVEDAGFEVRDQIVWLFGSGFPKSLDVGKAIDKAAGAERTERVGVKPGHENRLGDNMLSLREGTLSAKGGFARPWMSDPEAVERAHYAYAPATSEAAAWDGWGTALKPANEPIVVARKPLRGTVAGNVLKHGTGALNIGACRVGFQGAADEAEAKAKNRHGDFDSAPRNTGAEGRVYGEDHRTGADRGNYDPPGRWPANVVLAHLPDCRMVGERRVQAAADVPPGNLSNTHAALEGGPRVRNGWSSTVAGEDGMERVEEWECAEGCAVAELNAQSGVLSSGAHSPDEQRSAPGGNGVTHGAMRGAAGESYPGEGGASRFFATFNERFRYVAKAGTLERNAGLGGFAEQRKPTWSNGEANPGTFQSDGTSETARNVHPTVKPIELMRWLVRLVTPPGGRVLDPFLGSGTTGCAAVLEGFDFTGIEREAEYVPIARARIEFWASAPADVPVERVLTAERDRQQVAETGQLGLL